MLNSSKVVFGGLATLATVAQAKDNFDGDDISEVVDFIDDNQWIIGVFCLIAGLFIALQGVARFRHVSSTVTCIAVFGALTAFCLSMDLMTNTGATIGILIAALCIGLLAGYFVRRNIWVMVSLLGLVAGFFAGCLICALVYGISSWSDEMAFWIICTALAVLGCVFAYHYGRSLVLYSTAMVGSYLFMRSWTLFFPGHYPSEMDLVNGNYRKLDDDFWMFFGVFVISFAFSSWYQHRYYHGHGDLDDAFKSN